MKLTLDELRADLIVRWKAAFDRFTEVQAEVDKSAETLFTQSPDHRIQSAR